MNMNILLSIMKNKINDRHQCKCIKYLNIRCEVLRELTLKNLKQKNNIITKEQDKVYKIFI